MSKKVNEWFSTRQMQNGVHFDSYDRNKGTSDQIPESVSIKLPAQFETLARRIVIQTGQTFDDEDASIDQVTLELTPDYGAPSTENEVLCKVSIVDSKACSSNSDSDWVIADMSGSNGKDVDEEGWDRCST